MITAVKHQSHAPHTRYWAGLALIFTLLYLRFLFHLPPRIRNLFILAGVCYVGGAVIVEAISANRYSLDGGVPYLI